MRVWKQGVFGRKQQSRCGNLFFVFPPGRQLRDMVQTEHILARDGGSTGND